MKALIMKIRELLKPVTSDRRHEGGYTLVEVMVSGILMTFSISAVVAVMGTGSQLGVSDENRRQARAVVRTSFEQEYDFRNFNTIPDSMQQVDSVAINPRQGNALTGERITRVVIDSMNTDNGVGVPVKRITITLRWVDVDGAADSVFFTKLLAGI